MNIRKSRLWLWFGGAIVLVALVCTYYVAVKRAPEEWGASIAAKRERIHRNMTDAEVVELLGEPGNYCTDPQRAEFCRDTLVYFAYRKAIDAIPSEHINRKKTWTWNEAVIWVDFDENGKVYRVDFARTPSPESILQRMRRHLRDNLGI